MKRLICTVAAAILFFAYAGAQRADASVKGKVTDTTSGKPMMDATVSIIQPKDSAVISFSLTNAQGLFEIRNLVAGSYRLIISHQGYTEIKKTITLGSKQQLDLGNITPAKDIQLLGEVIVTSESPIVIKKDTIQFNASAFRTKPNAVVEDLLKKLPGVEVDREGTVKAQGETVQKIYVDGKEFFGNDPKMATRNLTAEMVESVQVFDDMSDQAKFTKIDDGSRTKTINIKLKKNRRRGYFGRAMVGYGDDGRYKGNLSINKFNEEQRLSLVYNTNNVNEQGFSVYDGGGGGGRGNLRGGGSTGINKTWNLGTNYVDEWGRKIKISGNYALSDVSALQEQSIVRQSIFSDSVAVLNKTTSALNKTSNHQFNLRFEYEIDSLTSILFTPSLSVQNSEYNSMDTSFNYSELPGIKYLSIEGGTRNNSRYNSTSWNNNLLFRRRFGKVGRTLILGWSNTSSHNDNAGYTFSENRFYTRDGSPYQTIYQNQQNNPMNKTRNNILSVSYTEPVGRNKIVELNYAYTNNFSIADKKTFDYNPLTGRYDSLNLLLTNNFENTLLAHRFGFNYRVQKIKYNYQVGIGMQRSSQESDSYQASTGKDSVIFQRYINFFPTANFNLTPSRGKNLRFMYSGRNNPPRIWQLQNVLDVSDPLNVTTGNPDLKQEFNHSFNAGYNSFNMRTLMFFAANVNFSTTSNKIVNSIDTLRNNIRLTRPANVNGFYQTSSYITMGFTFKNPKLKGFNISFSNNLTYSRDISLLYQKRNTGRTLTITPGATANLNKEKFDVGIRMNVIYTKVKYSVNESLNESFFAQTYSGDFSYSFPAGITTYASFDYYVNSGRAEGFNQSIPLLNAAIGKSLFKNKKGELRFTVNDILNQNQSITRSTGDNYIQDTRNLVLRRYVMVSFLYNLTKMGGTKKEKANQN